tara:strand:- start:240 stop:1841 length:1602 start_codon:yes stop_codon:yes gene_type:complete
MRESYDVIIIGAGASGLASAWYLCKEGLKVAIFEQGKLLNEQDYIPINKGGEIQKFKDLNDNPNVRKHDYDYLINSDNSPIDIANFNGIGGSTILFSGHYPRFRKSDFKTFSNDKVGIDWPIDYTILKKYYEINERITGVAGISGNSNYPDIKNLLPPVPLGKMGYILAKGFRKLNWDWWPSYSSINTIPYNQRPADDYQRPSNLGDVNMSKGSANNTYLPLAKSEGLIIKERCIVSKLICENNQIININYIDNDGSFHQAKAKIYIIAASGIGTPRLLLNSQSTSSTNTIANKSNLVGKNLMLHPIGYIEGLYKENLYSNFGPQGCCLMSQEFHETKEENGFKRGYTIQALRGPLPIESSLSLTNRKIITFGEKFWHEFESNYNHSVHMIVITEDLPDIRNQITINKNLINKYDQPGVNINYTLSDNSKRMLSHGINNSRKVLKASGAYKTFGYGPVRGTGWHTLGTCRMGNNPKESVVNKYGKCHDVNNLFIIDGSVFPTSSCVNPAATIQSLALYFSEKIISIYKELLAF